MKESTKTEQYFQVLDQGTEKIRAKEDNLYIEALGTMGEALFQRNFALAGEDLRAELEQAAASLPSQMHREEVRRAIQLAVLKGMKEAVQPHHAMTPDAVALFMGYLTNLLLQKEEGKPVLLDPAAGSGNLMTAVLNQLPMDAHFVAAEPDETLLKLAFMNANLQEHEVDLFHQDSVASPLLDHADAVVCDLPAGYYPDDETASGFLVKAEEEKTYVHHLLIERSIRHVKEGGFLVLLVPNQLFHSNQAAQLQEMIRKSAHIYAVLQLPETMFKTRGSGKSMLILRKKKDGIVPPSQALLAEMPSFTKEAALADMMKRISGWIEDNVHE
ncbi:class I SAM-dependent methyltransferase [Alkalicoccus luteus]|uniref:class I SAM-dependent methyltransferase n=1 Tax=Alkalicoccus luteus TaxID=1237094 RepID=UPI0040343128